MTQEAIEIESAQALKSVSMDIPENRVTAVIGPAGRCKSTFIRCINRMNDLISKLKRDYTIVIVTPNMRAGSESIRAHGVFPAWKDESDRLKSGKEE